MQKTYNKITLRETDVPTTVEELKERVHELMLPVICIPKLVLFQEKPLEHGTFGFKKDALFR